MSDQGLSPSSSISEIFEAIQPEEGMRVLPTEVPADEGKKNLAILIAGREDECNVLMANLMAYVQDMHEISQQKEAEGAIINQDGEVIEDEPSIIIP